VHAELEKETHPPCRLEPRFGGGNHYRVAPIPSLGTKSGGGCASGNRRIHPYFSPRPLAAARKFLDFFSKIYKVYCENPSIQSAIGVVETYRIYCYTHHQRLPEPARTHYSSSSFEAPKAADNASCADEPGVPFGGIIATATRSKVLTWWLCIATPHTSCCGDIYGSIAQLTL
jgi:hypothetical protein